MTWLGFGRSGRSDFGCRMVVLTEEPQLSFQPIFTNCTYEAGSCGHYTDAFVRLSLKCSEQSTSNLDSEPM